MNRIFLLITIVFIISACTETKTQIQYELNKDTETDSRFSYPITSFAVISDLHIYHPSLGVSGSAFEETMNSDRKLLLDSIDLLDYVINDISASGVNFVIIPGDLTKDGEVINHNLAAEKFNQFTVAGISVYVVPGNHDVNCPDAVSYEGDKRTPVPTVSANDFSRIYGDFGYNSAIIRDNDSLSYVAEPVQGLWLLAIDACRYNENTPGKEAIVSGKLSQKTVDWITSVLKTAADRNKAVIAFIHHGVVEHWKGQAKLHPDYLIDDFIRFGEFLASWNVKLVFTGHYHAQDITRAQFGSKEIYDIETGSLVTAPCPIRYVEINDNVIQLRTETIVDKIYPGTDFAQNARAFVKKTVMLEALGVLKKFKVSDKDAEYIANAVGDAFDAHYAGDENPALRPPFDKSRLNLWGRFVYSQQKYVLDGLWEDLPPADNNTSFKLLP
jgi:hypothetical protein